MNPFEYIKELKQVVTANATNPENKDKTISYQEHCNGLMNMLNVLESEMEHAEYNYQVIGINYSDIHTFGELTVMQKELSDEVLIFQPIAVGEAELSAVDMKSLADVLTQLRDNGTINQNILLLPPNINIFKAVLKRPKDKENESEE